MCKSGFNIFQETTHMSTLITQTCSIYVAELLIKIFKSENTVNYSMLLILQIQEYSIDHIGALRFCIKKKPRETIYRLIKFIMFLYFNLKFRK